MKIYTLQHKENFQWLLPRQESDHRLFKFDGSPRQQTWKTVEMKVLLLHEERGPDLAPSDFPCSLGNLIVFSERAKEALSHLIGSRAEILPLSSDGRRNYWALNVTRLIDVLDDEKSDVVRSDTTGNILIPKKLIFRPEAAEERLFKLSEMPRGVVFLGEEFVKAVEDASLVGVKFKTVWELKAN